MFKDKKKMPEWLAGLLTVGLFVFMFCAIFIAWAESL